MNNSLVQYFIKFGHLVLPGLGILKWNKQEAYWEKDTLVSPYEEILLDPIDDTPSKSFYAFIGDELGLSIEEAITQYQDYIDQFTSQTISSLPIGNLGTIQKNASVYSWSNQFDSTAYFKNITPKMVADITPNDHNEDNKQSISWIIWTIVLAMVAFVIIVYKQF